MLNNDAYLVYFSTTLDEHQWWTHLMVTLALKHSKTNKTTDANTFLCSFFCRQLRNLASSSGQNCSTKVSLSST